MEGRRVATCGRALIAGLPYGTGGTEEPQGIQPPAALRGRSRGIIPGMACGGRKRRAQLFVSHYPKDVDEMSLHDPS